MMQLMIDGYRWYTEVNLNWFDVEPSYVTLCQTVFYASFYKDDQKPKKSLMLGLRGNFCLAPQREVPCGASTLGPHEAPKTTGKHRKVDARRLVNHCYLRYIHG